MAELHRIRVGDVPLPELHYPDELFANIPGIIRIGGDYADIEAAGGASTPDGLVLHDVDILTTRETVVPGNQWEIVTDIVYTAYESIGPECFRPCKER